MSLDFYLHEDTEEMEPCECTHCGNNHLREKDTLIFHANITHNLAPMANLAGLYNCLWSPDESGFVYAKDIVNQLRTGIQLLIDKRELFLPLNPENKWGSYENLLKQATLILEACENNLESKIEVWR